MKGTLRRLPDGTITARLTDRWGYVHTLTGTKTADGYEVEVALTEVPADLWLPGDQDHFKVAES